MIDVPFLSINTIYKKNLWTQLPVDLPSFMVIWNIDNTYILQAYATVKNQT